MTEQETKRKPSPPAPSRALEDCIDDVRILHKNYARGTFSKGELASALGVSSISGPFRTRLFSIRGFGLVDEAAADTYVVSDLFMALHENSPATPEYKQAAMIAVQGPEVFRNLLAQYSTKLPAKELIAQRLEVQMGFARDRAKDVALVFEKSLRATGVVDPAGNILRIRGDSLTGGSGRPSAVAPVEQGPSLAVDSEPSTGLLRAEVSLPGGRKAVVWYPEDMTSPEATKVGRVLQAMAEVIPIPTNAVQPDASI